MICIKCNQDFPKTDFYITKSGVINTKCRFCCNEKSKEYKANSENRSYLQLKRHYDIERNQNITKTLLLRDIIIAFNKRNGKEISKLIRDAVDVVKNKNQGVKYVK